MAGEKGTGYANGILASILTAVFSQAAISSLLQNAGSPLTNLYLSLHTSDPTAAGNQTSNEVAYTSYARAAVARSASGWTVSTNSATLTSAISFPACTGSSATANYLGVGTASSGAGNLLYAGPISPSISISSGVTPQLTTGTTITES